jgi:sorting nexin-29
MRLLPYAEEAVNYPCDFRHGKSNTDQIYTFRKILEKTVEYTFQTHHLFINFSTAHDSINRAQIFATIKKFNFPDKLIGESYHWK